MALLELVLPAIDGILSYRVLNSLQKHAKIENFVWSVSWLGDKAASVQINDFS